MNFISFVWRFTVWEVRSEVCSPRSGIRYVILEIPISDGRVRVSWNVTTRLIKCMSSLWRYFIVNLLLLLLRVDKLQFLFERLFFSKTEVKVQLHFVDLNLVFFNLKLLKVNVKSNDNFWSSWEFPKLYFYTLYHHCGTGYCCNALK